MNVACDYCDRKGRGNMDDLVKLGWRKAHLIKPFRQTFTACYQHGAELAADIDATLTEARDHNTSIRRQYEKRT